MIGTVTKSVEFGYERSEEMLLSFLLRNKRLLIDSSVPEFISAPTGLRSLEGSDSTLTVLRAGKAHRADQPQPKSKPAAHPEGGYPPKSNYPPGQTIWKWVSTYYGDPKELIEFHRETGTTIWEFEYEGDN